MQSVLGDVVSWNIESVDREFVPKLGKYMNDRNEVLVLDAACGRGKSHTFRQYMRSNLGTSRALMLSANILYGTNLAHELKLNRFDVGFYKEHDDFASKQVVVCSLESLHLLYEQRFDLIFIDEARTISNAVGGETMKDFTNLYLLRHLCNLARKLVVSDADILYKSSDSEPVPAAYDFLKILSPSRQIKCLSLSHPGPPHLQRQVRLFYGCGPTNGTLDWFAEIDAACSDWHSNHDRRFAVNVGSKSQMQTVCEHIRIRGVPLKPYSSSTSDEHKYEDLKDPDAAWASVGAIVSTTTLSIGVDPKEVQFARVFIQTCRVGCSFLSQAQAALRYGRSSSHPLLNSTIDILVDCKPHQEAKKYADYDVELAKQTRKRAKRIRLEASQRGAEAISDHLLRLLAHKELEHKTQRLDMRSTVLRVCAHHKWRVVESPISTTSFADVDPADVDEDDDFAVLQTKAQKMQWALSCVDEHFFTNYEDPPYPLSSRDKFLKRTYYQLRNLRRVVTVEEMQLIDDHFDGLDINARLRCMTAEQQIQIDTKRALERRPHHPFIKPGIGHKMKAIQECAHLLGVESLFRECELPVIEEQEVEREMLARLQSTGHLLELNAPSLNNFLSQLAKACGMKLVRETKRPNVAGVRKRALKSLHLQRILPHLVDEWLVWSDSLKKQVRVKDWDSEHEVIESERMMRDELDDIFCLGASVVHVAPLLDKCVFLERVDGRLTLRCSTRTGEESIYETAARASETNIDWIRESKQFKWPRIPIDNSVLFIFPLGAEPTGLESVPTSLLDDDAWYSSNVFESPQMYELRSFLKANGVSHSASRIESLDAASLESEIRRLTSLTSRTDRESRNLSYLKDIEAEAERVGPWLQLSVCYSKKSQIGRRYASYPSMQGCPSDIRRLLVRHHHDIDIVSCHPTIFLHVATKMGATDLDLLEEYVEHSKTCASKADVPLLKRIGDFYGVKAEKCKYAVLSVLNGGSPLPWIRDAECTRNTDKSQADLEELSRISTVVRQKVFELPEFKQTIDHLKQTTRVSVASKLQRCKAIYDQAPIHRKQEALQSLHNAERKTTPISIERSVFSQCIFEIEDTILGQIDAHFKEAGWTVASLQFDGLHVEHREADINLAMRAAEARVKQRLGYDIKLVEKPLYSAD